jgi:hypothetical protein
MICGDCFCRWNDIETFAYAGTMYKGGCWACREFKENLIYIVREPPDYSKKTEKQAMCETT